MTRRPRAPDTRPPSRVRRWMVEAIADVDAATGDQARVLGHIVRDLDAVVRHGQIAALTAWVGHGDASRLEADIREAGEVPSAQDLAGWLAPVALPPPRKATARLASRRSGGGLPAAACPGWRGRIPWGQAIALEASSRREARP